MPEIRITVPDFSAFSDEDLATYDIRALYTAEEQGPVRTALARELKRRNKTQDDASYREQYLKQEMALRNMTFPAPNISGKGEVK